MRRHPSPYSYSHLSDPMMFGRYKHLALSDVIDMCPSYIEWCVNTIHRFVLRDEVMEEIHQVYPGCFVSEDFEIKRKWNEDHWMDCYLEDSEIDVDDEYDDQYESPTYDRYGGSWAQDEMGYSDDDIDTIFDGDPDAYWNID